MFDDRSVNYNIPIPNVANTLSVDVGRLREAIAMIDGLFKTNADLQGADAGFYPDAVNYATHACSRVTITWGLAASRYSDVTYLWGLNVAKRESITTDTNGRGTVTHNICTVLSFISVGLVDFGGAHTCAVEYDYPTATTFQIRVYNKTTNVNAGDGTFVINWKAEE